MWPEIIRAVIDRPVLGIPVRLKDVQRVRVQHEVYPAIIPCNGASVDGVLYENLSQSEMASLDLFEGVEYERRVITVVVNGRSLDAETYFAADSALLEKLEWRPEQLSDEQLNRFRETYKGWTNESV
jgi:gamma-glutamylcyclotransferase (GGCT)/AIG2-like uncharacterized protein YtfP